MSIPMEAIKQTKTNAYIQGLVESNALGVEKTTNEQRKTTDAVKVLADEVEAQTNNLFQLSGPSLSSESPNILEEGEDEDERRARLKGRGEEGEGKDKEERRMTAKVKRRGGLG